MKRLSRVCPQPERDCGGTWGEIIRNHYSSTVRDHTQVTEQNRAPYSKVLQPHVPPRCGHMG